MVYSGFWAADVEGTPDNQNAGLVQYDTAGNRPAAAKEGVLFFATDTGELSRDNGSSWDSLGFIDSAGPFDQVAHIATGTYTGDGATSQAITGVGFQPKYVLISKRQTSGANYADREVVFTTDVIVDDSASGMAIQIANASNTTQGVENAIISLDADGFTVDDSGADADPNANTIVYNYLAIG
jgi:hypothetical protein